MSNKTIGVILGVLGRLQNNITFDECHRNKTYYDGVKHGIKLSKKAIENIPKEDYQNRLRRMKMENKINKLIEIIEFLVDVDHGITVEHANMIYQMLNDLKEYD